MSTLLNTMKLVAHDTMELASPAAWFFGEVKSVAPLTIYIDDQLSLTEHFLVLMREFRSGVYNTHTHFIPAHNHAVYMDETDEAEDHTHTLPLGETEDAALTTSDECYGGLAVGDRVVLLRNHGGQQFLVLGRM